MDKSGSAGRKKITNQLNSKSLSVHSFQHIRLRDKPLLCQELSKQSDKFVLTLPRKEAALNGVVR